MARRRKRTDCTGQAVLPFDFWEDERRQEEERLRNLPTFSTPQNDNERLFNLQWEYYNGNREEAWNLMFWELGPIAARLARKQAKQEGLKFQRSKIREIADDAVIYFMEQVSKNSLTVDTSFVAYLRLQVIKAMHYRNKAQRLEEWCVKRQINLLALSDSEKQNVKMRFERYERRMRCRKRKQ